MQRTLDKRVVIGIRGGLSEQERQHRCSLERMNKVKTLLFTEAVFNLNHLLPPGSETLVGRFGRPSAELPLPEVGKHLCVRQRCRHTTPH